MHTYIKQFTSPTNILIYALIITANITKYYWNVNIIAQYQKTNSEMC